MKLLLTSDQLIGKTTPLDQALLTLFETNHPTIGYIPSSSDPTRKYFNAKVAYYQQLGIHDVTYYDCDLEFDETTFFRVFDCDGIHLSGGNTFYFLHTLKKRGLLSHLKAYVERGGVLIGVSAGSILMTPSIETARFGDEVLAFDGDYSALHLVDFAFMPHWSSDEHERYYQGLKQYANKLNITVYLAHDGDGILVNDETITLIGDIERI